jgi:calcium-dependent protein kinase
MKMYELFEDANYFYIVSELCCGRELYEVLKNKKKFTEAESFDIFYQLISAVSYLHKNFIMHRYLISNFRDLKLENIIYDEKSSSIKLIDFGTATQFYNHDLCERRCIGTVLDFIFKSSYLAPEVITKLYN